MKVIELRDKLNQLMEENPESYNFSVISFNEDLSDYSDPIDEPYDGYLVTNTEFGGQGAVWRSKRLTEADCSIRDKYDGSKNYDVHRVVVLFEE